MHMIPRIFISLIGVQNTFILSHDHSPSLHFFFHSTLSFSSRSSHSHLIFFLLHVAQGISVKLTESIGEISAKGPTKKLQKTLFYGGFVKASEERRETEKEEEGKRG